MRNVGGGNFISEEGSVQLDMTKEIVVTVTGCGVVTIWSRKTMLPLYRNHHHGYEPVLGVRCLGDLVVTGGIQVTPFTMAWNNEKPCIQGSMAVLTVRKEKVTLESIVEEPGQTSINHLDVQVQKLLKTHLTTFGALVFVLAQGQKDIKENLFSTIDTFPPSQGDHILVGTDRDMRLWGVEDRQKPKLLSTVRFPTLSKIASW